ncbi:hypothetical protein HMPREF9420_1911 [Segatella salivae DSM 15606]|uniref:Uncharacterized protein n=1 Tax=Segatella salivae DSM 15606 TaxID=888832 RepID=E6MQZ3_9BACT|nr:hypothetical protein HMPREF9420_1911 [Segatella salivae DSM 15606]
MPIVKAKHIICKSKRGCLLTANTLCKTTLKNKRIIIILHNNSTE